MADYWQLAPAELAPRGRDKSEWEWTVMIMTPDWITAEHVDIAREAVHHRGGAPALDTIRLAPLDEGLAVQTLHVGSYDAIHLSDAPRTSPDKLRTILRQPVTASAAP